MLSEENLLRKRRYNQIYSIVYRKKNLDKIKSYKSMQLTHKEI
jgi:hypothetical protein